MELNEWDYEQLEGICETLLYHNQMEYFKTLKMIIRKLKRED